MMPSRNAWWLGALSLASVHAVLASPALAPAPTKGDGVTLRLNIYSSPSLGGVTGAQVELRRLDADAPPLSAAAGPDGQVVVSGVPPGRYRAVVRKEGFGDAVAAALDLGTGPQVESRAVTLLAGDAPIGRVTDPTGRAIAGARVCFGPPVTRAVSPAQGAMFTANAAGSESVCAVSAPDGSIGLARIPYGHYKVAAEAVGYGSIDGEVTDFKAGREPRTWVLTPAGTITGRVQDAQGQGIAGVNVTFRDRVRGTTLETITDGGGAFRSEGLAAGTWRVEVQPAEYRALLRDSIVVKATQTVNLGILRARPAGAISGRLVGPDGTPVARAEVRAVPTEGLRRALRTTTSDDNGAFRLAGLEDGVRVDVIIRPVPGFTARTVRGVEVPSTDVTMALQRTRTLTGVARAEDGTVPAHAYVTVFPSVGHPALEANAGLAASATVDAATGTFVVQNVPSGGEVEVRVNGSGSSESSTRVSIPETAQIPAVELVVHPVPAEAVVKGRVVDTNGLPVAGASLGRTASDENGRFALPVSDAISGNTIVMHPAYAPLKKDFSEETGEEPVVVLDAGGVIEGAVVDAEGRPLAGVRVSADGLGGNAVTGIGGRYRIEHVPPGTTWVRRQGLGVVGDTDGAKVSVESGQVARSEFRTGSVSISGALSRGGALAEGADLLIQQPPDSDGSKAGRSRFQAATTDEEGRFKLLGLDPGPARLTVNSGGQSIILLIEVPEGGASGLELNLPSRIIEGVVLDESGKTMKGACVASPVTEDLPPEIEPRISAAKDGKLGDAIPPAWSRVTTGSDGRFRVAVNDPVPTSLSVCTCAQGCLDVPLDGTGDGEPVTLWFDPRLLRTQTEEE